MQAIESFQDEAQAYAEIEGRGFHAVALDFPGESNDFHWHDFDAVVYITAGQLKVVVEGHGEPYICTRGTKFNAAAGVVHREESEGYSAIIGLSVPPENLTQPVNKTPPVDTAV